MEASGMVSIILLSHNKARFVEESVRSVMAQTYQDWELLFVDDPERFFFGYYMDKEHVHYRPLSKLAQDIISIFKESANA